jgi:oligopeptidase A
MTNPLLDTSALPRFADLTPEHAEPALRQLIAAHQQKLAKLLESPDTSDFSSLVTPLEEMDHELGRVWSPVGHLQSVLGDPGWRDAYNACLPLLTEHGTDLSQNQQLQQAFERVASSLPADAAAAKRAVVDKALRDFRLAGVDLPEEKKAEFRDAKQKLAMAQALFDQNVQDSTDAWHLQIDDEQVLAGLPSSVVERAKQDATEKEFDGWWLDLDFPTYHAVMTHADDRELRHVFYKAWTTRASKHADKPNWDNSENIENILALRHRLALLVGFENYADYSLATKMASSTDEVLEFLSDLVGKTRGGAEAELEALRELADEPLEAWDTSYYLEILKREQFSVSDELLRQYFPSTRVQDGLFDLANQLYNVTIRKIDTVQGWHETVVYYQVLDGDGATVGGFYIDLFARSGKRSGAWIDECICRKNLAGDIVDPVGYLVCNFQPPDKNGVSLLTHVDVITLFHEFGHMLHHLLTRVDYPSVAGINGVPWDAVELPSQFMENFAWSYDVLKKTSGHIDSGEPLPEDIFERLLASRQCGAALAMFRQLEFALFDFRIHAGYCPEQGARTLEILKLVREDVALIQHPDFNRFPMSFSHIFAGGYAAGYYSYKWAEVLAADAFSAFEESGLFDAETAARFRAEILEIGGSRDIMEAFVAFRGRKPQLDALLRHSGIGKAA